MPNTLQQEILDRLEQIRQNKSRQIYMQPRSYQDFMPRTTGYQKPDDSQRYAVLDQIGEQGVQATANLLERDRQRKLHQQYVQQQRALNQAKSSYQQAKSAQPQYAQAPAGGAPMGTTGSSNYGGYDPANSKGFKAGVGQYLTTVHAAGLSFTVNKYVANRFVNFVNALTKRGYKPVSIGGYANRNQASGTGLKSLHAYGLAIDIDPAVNPMVKGSAPHKMPDWAGSLAAKYGLVWGGTWKHSKDYMHFSVPYGGRM